MTEVLRLEDFGSPIRKGTTGIQSVSLTLAASEVVWLTLPEGTATSTFTRLLLGEIRPHRGSIHFQNNELKLKSAPQRVLLRRQTGLFGRTRTLIEQLTVYDNAAIPLRVLGLDSYTARIRTLAALRQVDLLAQVTQRAESLTIAQRRSLMLAQVIAKAPPLVLAEFEEADSCGAIGSSLARLAEYGSAVLIVAALPMPPQFCIGGRVRELMLVPAGVAERV